MNFSKRERHLLNFLLEAMRFDMFDFHQYAFLMYSVLSFPNQDPQVSVPRSWTNALHFSSPHTIIIDCLRTNNVKSIRRVKSHGRKKQLFFPGGRKSRGVQLCPRASLTFSRPLRRVDEHAATRQRAAKLIEWMPIKSGPSPQMEPT